MTEQDIQAKFVELLPRILGGLFGTIAQAWARVPHVELDVLPRMADAAVWFAAVDEVFENLGVESRSLQLLTDSKEALFEAIVESDELAIAVLSFMGAHPNEEWTGTASDLRKGLANGSSATGLPATAAALARKLRSSATPLREAGILDITFHRSGTKRIIDITRLSRWSD